MVTQGPLQCTRCCLPLISKASASRRKCLSRKYLSRLNTLPARTPVNASMPPHGQLGAGMGYYSFTVDSFSHYTAPTLPAQGGYHYETYLY
jgi:hypothetical protein